MGVYTNEPDHARPCSDEDRQPDRGKTPTRLRTDGRVANGLIALFLIFASAATSAVAADLRIALWHTPLARKGPGLLLRDIQSNAEGIGPIVDALREANADVIVLTRIDYDMNGVALQALSDAIGFKSNPYVSLLPLRGNTGIPTGTDIDKDGKINGPRDAQAYGWFPGQDAMAVLSRFKIDGNAARSHSDLLWSQIEGTLIAKDDPAYDVQRLSTSGHWVFPVTYKNGRSFSLFVGAAGPPVFDGPEDRNGRRNRDELRLWEQLMATQKGPVIFAANTNLDPDAGEGDRAAMATFLNSGRWQDPLKRIPTVTWNRAGDMRVSYLLATHEFEVVEATVWPAIEGARHRLITLDVNLGTPSSP